MCTHPTLIPYIVSTAQSLKKIEIVERWLSTQELEYLAAVFLDQKGKCRSEVWKYLLSTALAISRTGPLDILSLSHLASVDLSATSSQSSRISLIGVEQAVDGAVEALGARKRHFFVRFYTKNEHFAKTGSGQT